MQELRRNRPVSRQTSGAAPVEEYSYRQTVDIGGLPVILRSFPRSANGRVGIIATAGMGGQSHLGNQMHCPILTIETAEAASMRTLGTEFAEAALRSQPLIAEAKQIALMGPSGGGFVALSIGMAFARLLPDRPIRVVAFNPPTKVWPAEPSRMGMSLYRQMIEGAEQDPEVARRLETHGDLVPQIERLWQDAPGADFRALVVGSLFHDRDAWHVGRITGMRGIHTLMLETDVHTVHRMMTVPLHEITGKAQFAKNLYKFDPEGMSRKTSVTEQEADDVMAVTLKLRSRFPHVRAMFDWLDSQPAEAAAGEGTNLSLAS